MLIRFKKNELPPQIFDLLQLSRKERECRNACSAAIRKFYHWKKSCGAANDAPPRLPGQIEGILLRLQAHDAVTSYRNAKKERRLKFQQYMDRLPERKNLVQAA